jgi:hypothetical protein
MFFIPSGGTSFGGYGLYSPSPSLFLDFGPGYEGMTRRDDAAHAIMKRAPRKQSSSGPTAITVLALVLQACQNSIMTTISELISNAMRAGGGEASTLLWRSILITLQELASYAATTHI